MARQRYLPQLAEMQQLTLRERVILAQLVKEYSSKQAARKLVISPRKVEFHCSYIMRKMGARNAADLVSIVLWLNDPGSRDARSDS